MHIVLSIFWPVVIVGCLTVIIPSLSKAFAELNIKLTWSSYQRNLRKHFKSQGNINA